MLATKENARLTPQTSNPSAESFDQALSNLSAHAQNLIRSLEFSVDRESGDTVVKVVDSNTKEVIRQIPSEEVLAIAHRLQAGYGGLLKEKA
ncbi:MAG: flagellar protein FlaG [Gammaproteobacteria bacterium]|nr:flagellar protein FlaG [Gammaproteobacteria bacterium]